MYSRKEKQWLIDCQEECLKDEGFDEYTIEAALDHMREALGMDEEDLFGDEDEEDEE